MLVGGDVNLRVGIFRFQTVVHDAECIGICSSILIHVSGLHVVPHLPRIDFISDDPVINCTVSGIGVTLTQEGSDCSKFFCAGLIRSVQRIIVGGCTIPGKRMNQSGICAQVIQYNKGDLDSLIIQTAGNGIILGNDLRVKMPCFSVVLIVNAASRGNPAEK